MPQVTDALDTRGSCAIKNNKAYHSTGRDKPLGATPNSAVTALEPPNKRQKRQRRRARACRSGESNNPGAEIGLNKSRHRDDELFGLAEALVDLASGSSPQTCEIPLENDTSLFNLETAFPDEERLPTEKVTTIQKFLQDYLSDFRILHDSTMKQTLGLVEDSTPTLATGVSKYTQALTDQKLEDGYQQQSTALEGLPVFAALHKKLCHLSSPLTLLDVLKLQSSMQPQERQKVVECLKGSYSTVMLLSETAHCADDYMWLDGEFLLKDSKIRASGASSLRHLVQAVWNRPGQDNGVHQPALPLRVAWFPPTRKWMSLATEVLQFLLGSGWDKSSLGQAGSGCELPGLSYTPYTQAKGGQESRIRKQCQEALQLLENFVNSTEIPTDISSAVLKNETVLIPVIGKWKIGRPWTLTTTLSVLQDALQSRTVLIDNIPFKCTPAQLGRMVELETGHQVAHVSIPRFSVSRENKGFGFVEMRSKDDAEGAIKQLNGRWPSGWDNAGTAGSETFIRRNKRPLLVLSHSEWKTRKKQTTDVSNLPSGGCWGTSAKIAKSFFSTTPVWARLDGITPPITTLGIWHYVEHSVTPLQVVYHPPDRFALVLLKSVKDLKKLEIDGILGGRALTGWKTSASTQSFVKVSLTVPPSRSATLCDSPDCTLVVGHLPCSKQHT